MASADVSAITALEPEFREFSAERLRDESKKLADEIKSVSEENLFAELTRHLPRAFALVREAARRTLNQRHFDVQLIGGVSLFEGKIVEMRTGEGKTLAATSPAYLHALAGRGVHVVTVNEYLAKRDAVWMGQVYHALGLSVACLVHDGALLYDPHYRIPKEAENASDAARDATGAFIIHQEYLRPISRRDAYAADITYGTNHEFGFDYLRDNLAYSSQAQVQRGHHYAIIDEVDSILIDEARTPLIISAPDQESSSNYKTFARVVANLAPEEDYLVDEKLRSADITESGINKVERVLNIKNIFEPEHLRLTHYLQESLRAKALFLKDRDYVVKDGQIVIVDQFTGRLMVGRRYSGGLHQAIEAKEGVLVQQESRTYAQVSIQNYFRLYRRLGGMTGTAQTSAEEFDKVYKLPVVTVPTHRPMVRQDEPDLIYKNLEAKYAAIIADIRARHEKGQPILIGTVSIEKNEDLSRRLTRAGLPHEVLNAKNNEREGAIIAQAGRARAITVATNMAGRGVDIILGGNPPESNAAEKVKTAGGLHVIGTERHEARRIDNQLRGRAGRQGDPGSSQFFLSLEDDLMRIFGGGRIKGLMERLNVPEDMPIQANLLNKAISQAQAKVEGANFDSRKHLLDYDDVLNKQRQAIYEKRQKLLAANAPQPILGALDMFWMTHLEDMEALAESVRLRAYGQHDPLVEYRREGHGLYQTMMRNFEEWQKENAEKLQNVNREAPSVSTLSSNSIPLTTGIDTKRNDPCPCGSGKKFKKCHGKQT